MKPRRLVQREITDTSTGVCLIEAMRDSGEHRAMLERIAKLEQRMDSVLPTLSTKADVERMRSDMHKGLSEVKAWMIGTILAMLVALATLGVLIGNRG